MINVTKTYLPPIEEYNFHLKRIWKSEWLTNRGELVQELEERLKEYLSIPYVLAMNNGTIPIQIALKILGVHGEIITTPFSYVATSSAIIWENCTPVYVDIHPEYFTIDETRIAEAITPATTAILATHVYGNPCHVEEIEQIARKHNLYVIYDAAHAFGVTYKGRSLLSYGDVSTCSFHATKLFHTGEGGAFISQDKKIMELAFNAHNFGHKGPLEFHGLGINGKMSELQAAMGLAVLPHMESIIDRRAQLVKYYDEALNSNRVSRMKIREHTNWNNCYYPILFDDERLLLAVESKLHLQDIHPRRYFYPALNTIEYTKGRSMQIAEDISKRILCLPLYFDLEIASCERIANIING